MSLETAGGIKTVKDKESASQYSETERKEMRNNDLLHCLQFLANHFGRASSPEILTTGLPLDLGQLTPPFFIEAAKRASLAAKCVRYPLAELSSIYLPCVIYILPGRPILLLSIGISGRASIFLPDLNAVEEIELSKLEQLYLGYGFLVKPLYLPSESLSESQNSENLSKRPGGWFWGEVRSYWRSYIHVALAAVVINLLGLAMPLFTMNVYDRVLASQAESTLIALSMGVIIALCFDFLLRTARSMLVDRIGRLIDIGLSKVLLGKVLNCKLSNCSQIIASFSHRFNEYEGVRDVLTSGTIVLLTDFLFVSIFLVFFTKMMGWLVLFPILGFLIVLLSGLAIQNRSSKLLKEADDLGVFRQTFLLEILSALETIKSLSIENHILKKWVNLARQNSMTQERIRFLSALMGNIALFVQQLVIVCVVIGGCHLFAQGQVSLGMIIASVMLVGRACGPFGQLAVILTRANQAMKVISGLDALMNQPDEWVPASSNINRSVHRGEISFRSVSFSYPGSKRKVLDGINLIIKPGERVGIIGAVGSGKTTLGRLLTGLYAPDAGEILVDGVDIGQYHPHAIRRAFCLAAQDVDFFQGSVRENITIGKSWVSEEELMQVSRSSGVDDFISRHPLGFGMPVGERGRNLSGGQRQSIACARALLNKPKLLFLDEPSSAIDIASEQRLVQRLSFLFKPEMSLVISTHRYTLLSLVDRLILLDKGRLIADGNCRDVLKLMSRHVNPESKNRNPLKQSA